MGKLLQLLNEYQTQRGSKFKFSSYDERSQSFLLVDSNEVLWEETIINKKFWFIEWLVNDKIDIDKTLKEYWMFRYIYFNAWIKSISDRFIMYLSIQDDPISFLISILK